MGWEYVFLMAFAERWASGTMVASCAVCTFSWPWITVITGQDEARSSSNLTSGA